MNKENEQLKKECIEKNIPFVEYDFDFSEPLKNPNYRPPEISDDKDWLKDIYVNILNMYVKDDDEGLVHWLKQIEEGRSRENILHYFTKVAIDNNSKAQKKDFAELFDDNGIKKILFVLKESMGDAFICLSLLKSIKEQYPEYDIYIGTQAQYAEIFNGSLYVHKIIPYHEMMESEMHMIGFAGHKGYVDVYMHPAIQTQRQLNYLSNSKLGVELC